jgi:hypothetical protein
VAPETVQTAVVAELNVTGSPEEAAAWSARMAPWICVAIAWNEIVWAAPVTEMFCETIAAVWVLLAATEAVIVHVPAVRKLTVVPETVQTVGVVEANVTGELEVVVALSAAVCRAVAAGTVAKVIVDAASTTVTVCETEAAAYMGVAATVAVSKQEPFVMKFTVLPETVQTDNEFEANVTIEVDDVVALSVAKP